MGDYGSDWVRLRAEHIKANPQCVLCGAPATVVHHRLEVKAAPLLLLDAANLVSLCRACHARHHLNRKRQRMQGDMGL